MAVPSSTEEVSRREEFDGGSFSVSSGCACRGIDVPSSSTFSSSSKVPGDKASTDFNVGFVERTISAAGASVLSAILVNPLDVAKVGYVFFFCLFPPFPSKPPIRSFSVIFGRSMNFNTFFRRQDYKHRMLEFGIPPLPTSPISTAE